MAEPFTCSCGTQTRQPYLVNGNLMCVLCTDRIAPRLVNAKSARDWQTFISSNGRTPTKPGYRARWRDDELEEPA